MCVCVCVLGKRANSLARTSMLKKVRNAQGMPAVMLNQTEAHCSCISTVREPGTAMHMVLSLEQNYFCCLCSEELFQELKQDIGSHGEAWFIAQTLVGTLLVFSPFKLQGLVDLVGTVCLTTVSRHVLHTTLL